MSKTLLEPSSGGAGKPPERSPYNDGVPAKDSETRLRELEAENADLRSQLDFVRNQSLDKWLSVVHAEGSSVRDYENTVSWRVTAPLRSVRRVQSAIKDIGFGPVAAAGMRRVRTRLRAR